MVPIAFPTAWRWTSTLNRIWANIFFTLGFFPYTTEYRFDKKQFSQYIFCPNHFSYLDIPAMGLNKIDAVFVGKNDMEKIPLFGYMYKKLHITVNRNSLKSRYETMLKSAIALEEGKSLMIFPEGGIMASDPPNMVRFKDGAFRAAIEKQIPVVPVTIAHNWIILPDEQWLPKRKEMKVIYHEPLVTQGMTMDDISKLKEQTFQVIDTELQKTKP